MYNQALVALKQGHPMRLPDWIGFWYWDYNANRIRVMMRDGNISDDVWASKYSYRDDWEVANGLSIAFAVLSLKAGNLVTRICWQRGMFLQLSNNKFSASMLDPKKVDSTEPILPERDIVSVTAYRFDADDFNAMDWEPFYLNRQKLKLGSKEYIDPPVK